jgi:hypothetical protein
LSGLKGWTARQVEGEGRSGVEWEVIIRDGRSDPWFVALVYGDCVDRTAEENARLIAATPALLEALQLFSREYDGFEDGDGQPCPVLAKARAAITAATHPAQAPVEEE